MPQHDYQCAECGWILADQYRSIDVGAQANPPDCFNCDTPMSWIPQISRMDAFEPGQEHIVYNGQNQPVLVESVAQMRKIERESEQQHRNGEGQPMRFRALHQNRGNMLDNTFGDIPREQPSLAGKRKFGLQGAAKAVDGAPDRAFGPGVNESNTSALKD